MCMSATSYEVKISPLTMNTAKSNERDTLSPLNSYSILFDWLDKSELLEEVAPQGVGVVELDAVSLLLKQTLSRLKLRRKARTSPQWAMKHNHKGQRLSVGTIHVPNV